MAIFVPHQNCGAWLNWTDTCVGFAQVKVCYLSEGDSHEESEEERLEELLGYYRNFIHPELQLSVELFPIK